MGIIFHPFQTSQEPDCHYNFKIKRGKKQIRSSGQYFKEIVEQRAHKDSVPELKVHIGFHEHKHKHMWKPMQM